mmetsp:Transcript_32774/g.74082  ORF Transcript_32774/g.74082 Transcript_32774/m.74082 type:complete len:222 (-) Transcript_32774:388-1053(-)
MPLARSSAASGTLRMLRHMPSTASAGDMPLTARYLSTPERATHSRNSSKSRTAISSVSACRPTSSWSAACESMKAFLACGIENFHRYVSFLRRSPTMSEVRVHVQSPMRSCLSTTRVQSSNCILSVVMPEMPCRASSELIMTYHRLRSPEYFSMTALTDGSSMTVSRKSDDWSLRARGRISSSIMRSRQPGSMTFWALSLKLPCVGLARWKAMRVSTLRNS